MFTATSSSGDLSQYTAPLWNQAYLGRYTLDMPAIPMRGFAAKITQRDDDFRQRGGLFLLFNAASRLPADDFFTVQVKDHRDIGRPSLPLMAMEYANLLNLSHETSEFKALMLVANRAEMDAYKAVRPAYHNPHHYGDVFSAMANFVLTARYLGLTFFTQKQEALGLIAAMGHDIKHSGQSNPAGDPYYNEMISFEAIKPLLLHSGVDQASIEDIKTMLKVTSTDGPHHILKTLCAVQRESTSKDIIDSYNRTDTVIIGDELKADIKKYGLGGLVSRPNLMPLAAMLSDADLFASAGSGIDTQKTMSRLLSAEIRQSGKEADFTTPQSRMAFFDHIIGKDGFSSDMGRHFGNDSYQQMRNLTRNQISKPS